ncbi:multicopper oxidase domain-containing protein [Pseudomonas aeruginosa]|nr:multicopper oxidase domain-containing protein [Pseudomonas aeruginosa]EKT8064166.1 multicopper oxidase domain-containing protein [Pseudomonas aeruginosa]
MNDNLDQHSELLSTTNDRRTMLRRGLAFGFAAPALVPAIRAVAQDSHGHAEEATPETATGESDNHAGHTESPVPAASVQPFQRYDPYLAPAKPHRKKFAIDVQDVTVEIAPGVPFAGWSYDGTIPGRTFRVVEGDRVDITLRIDPAANAHHSIDIHAARTPPDVDFVTINPGEQFTWNFRAERPGAYLYHCGTPETLMHIGGGMYGAFIVDPKEGWSPAQELILVQSDFTLADDANGVKVPDMNRMIGARDVDYVVFNGHATQYVDEPIQVKVGEPIRIFVVNGGPNVWSSFHVVGAIFDRVLVNASPKNQLFDLQSVSIGPGESTCVEFTLDEPGVYTAVNHAFGHAAQGAVALIEAT